jgi:hypothetical protein
VDLSSRALTPSTTVPASAEQDQVQSNADLDIPTQQELLAQFRCDEIAAVAVETFLASVKTVRRRVETGEVLSDLGSSMASWLEIGLARFDRDASRYHAGVYTKKRTDLVGVLHAALSPLFLGHVKNLHKSVLRDFKAGLDEALKGRDYDFGEAVRKGREDAEARFREGADGASRLRPRADTTSCPDKTTLLSQPSSSRKPTGSRTTSLRC